MVGKSREIYENNMSSSFSVIAEKELKMVLAQGKNAIAIGGRVENPGVYEIEEGMTLKDMINLAGGIKNKKNFKAAQLGIPFGGFLTLAHLEKPLHSSNFLNNESRSIIVLSDEDCIVSFSKFYIEFLLGKVSKYPKYNIVLDEVERVKRILDRISKGKSNIRDIYLMRQLSEHIKEALKQKDNLILEMIDKFYDELEEHIDDHYCKTGHCIQLLKFRITDKCIGCTACKRVCPVHCISGEIKKKHKIDNEYCTYCGQCVVACPVNAIFEGDHSIHLLRDISTPSKVVIVQVAPAVRVAIGEAFGFQAGENIEKKLVAGLRQLGIDYVFDTSWAADLTIMEEATEFQQRLEAFYRGDDNVRLPILTSCCPAWVNFFEKNYPDMLDVPSSVKSPMSIFSTVAKDIWAKEQGYKRNQISVVAIMPCLAKKHEASRTEFSRGDNFDTDYVISTRELIRIFKDTGINLNELQDDEFDSPLGEYSGAGIIFGRTGGVIEATTRTTIETLTGQRLDNIEFEALRGWDGFRIAELSIGHIDLRIGIAHGLEEAGKMLDKIKAGEEFFHAIEIMACQGGCIGGGGQPKAIKKQETLEKRIEGLNSIDRSLSIRRSHENLSVQALYDKHLDYPMSRKAHELLHTKYFPKNYKK
ncbi:MAG: [FeFe] hydrogenase, group A [Fusobacteriaceae bacterium]